MATDELFGMGSVPQLEPFEVTGLGKEPMPSPAYSQELLSKATEKYPFVAWNNPLVSVGKGQGYAETFPPGEIGAPDAPRPQAMPLGQTGVEVYRPSQFTPEDIAAEMLHVDRYANQVRDYLRQSITPEQMAKIKAESLDYQESINQGLGEDRAIQNAIDAALRGYAVGQWPTHVNESIGYTPEQKTQLDALVNYMKNFGR